MSAKSGDDEVGGGVICDCRLKIPVFGVEAPGKAPTDDDEWCDKCNGLARVKPDGGCDGEAGRCDDGCVNCTLGLVRLNAELVFGFSIDDGSFCCG